MARDGRADAAASERRKRASERNIAIIATFQCRFINGGHHGLISSAQAVEHYEIARYGTLKSWATQLGMTQAAKLLDQTLQEEIRTDKLLSQLATHQANAKAA